MDSWQKAATRMAIFTNMVEQAACDRLREERESQEEKDDKAGTLAL